MISKKYADSLFNALSNDEEIVEVQEALARVSLVSKEPKFILVLNSPLSIEEKVNFLAQIAESKNEKLLNFFKIILLNKRHKNLKEIYQAFFEKVSYYFNTFMGEVDGNVSDETITQLAKKLSEKFNADIKLYKKSEKEDGIKVFVDVLNVEISVDERRIKQEILNTILKAI
jgi:F-type H+-transporting ATPase subunit delta